MRCPCLLYLAGGVVASALWRVRLARARGLAVRADAPILLRAGASARGYARRCSCSCCSGGIRAARRAEWGGARLRARWRGLPVWSRGRCARRAPPAWRAARAAHRRVGGAPCATAPSPCRRATCPSLWPAHSRRSTRRRGSSSSAAVRTLACRSSCGARGGWWGPDATGDASLRASDARLAAWFVQNYDLEAATLPAGARA